MKKAVALTIVAGFVASAVSMTAFANDAEGAFLGTGFGWNNYSDLGDVGTATKSSTPTAHVFGGYTFNEFLGA